MDIATNSEENEALAGSLPTFLRLHFIGLAEVGYYLSLKPVKEVELADRRGER